MVGVVETDMYVEGCCERVCFFVVDQNDQNDEVLLGMQYFNQTKMSLTHIDDGSITANFNFGGCQVEATVGSSLVRNGQAQELKIVVHKGRALNG